MNDYEAICKKQEKRKLCGNFCCNEDNEYICVYNSVRAYVNGDTKRLLKLKGESKVSDFWTYVSVLIAMLSFLISTLSFFFLFAEKVMGENSVSLIIYGILMLIAIAFVCILLGKQISKYSCVNKWGGYVQVAIEEMEYELGLRTR